MKISVVTATYNQAPFISQTIESVISQKGDFYIDYIIVNDGSTDNTLEIIEKYDRLLKSNKWPIECRGVTLRYWSKPNSGFTGTMNQGLKVTEGHAIAWLNSDDYFMPGTLETVRRAFEKNPEVDLLYGDCIKLYEDGRVPPSIEPRPREHETLETLRTRGNSFVINFFTKRILDKVGLLDESLQFCVDLDFWFKIYTAGGKSLYVPETLGTFRIWPGSKTSTKQKLFAEERRIIARRYGGNIMPQHKLYKLRKRFAGILNVFQKHTPILYISLKKVLYFFIDLLKYRKQNWVHYKKN